MAEKVGGDKSLRAESRKARWKTGQLPHRRHICSGQPSGLSPSTSGLHPFITESAVCMSKPARAWFRREHPNAHLLDGIGCSHLAQIPRYLDPTSTWPIYCMIAQYLPRPSMPASSAVSACKPGVAQGKLVGR